MHADQLPISAALVRALVDEQFPHWRHLPLHHVPGPGTVNAIHRLGDSLSVRLPLRSEPPEEVRSWLLTESRAMTELADAVSVPCPRVVAMGEPGHGYPLPWVIHTWLAGTTASVQDPSGGAEFAADLAALIGQMRAVRSNGRTYDGQGRGGNLGDHDAWVRECLERSRHLVDVSALARLWAEWVDLPPAGPDVMSHKDLIPGNVLVHDGRLAGLLDTGGFAACDPALDLVCAWHLLESGPRAVLRERLGSGDLEWARGMAWALQQAAGLGWYYERTNPEMSRLGVRTLTRLLEAATLSR